jgi:DNA topoisomerase VI subunit B
MSTIIDIGVESDHIESLTRASGINALSELIWNSLDADATEVHVEYTKNVLGGFESLSIYDNGHGLTFEKAKEVFSRVGGSEKKTKGLSPSGRSYHGKEGKGRYKSLALGDTVNFSSNYYSNGSAYNFTAVLDRNNLSRTEISDLKTLKKSECNTWI